VKKEIALTTLAIQGKTIPQHRLLPAITFSGNQQFFELKKQNFNLN
jgi:hypothetical protein